MTVNPSERTSPATPAEVADRAREWTDAQLACRATQHRWEPLRAVLNRTYGYWLCAWKCDRCDTEKNTELDADTGEIFGTWYGYQDGYLASGMGRLEGPARGAIRIANIGRTFPQTRLRAREAAKAEPRTRAAKLRKLKD